MITRKTKFNTSLNSEMREPTTRFLSPIEILSSTMADQPLHAPTNPHFFKPLLPGFHTHLDIPVAFFSKHVQGRNDHNKTAKLRSDAPDKTWIVKMNGSKFTEGWEDFSAAHDLRTGDMVVFRHEGDMVFHVTAMGPSCCEIQYTSSSSHNIDDDDDDDDDSDDHQTNNIASGNSSREKRNPREKGECSSESDHSSFEANVSASSLSHDKLYLTRSFARSNGLDKMSGKKIVLVNEEGRSWKLALKYNKSGKHTYVRPGWTSFCAANGMNRGDHYTFQLVPNSEPPVLRLCRADYIPKSESDSVSVSVSHHSCFKGSATPTSLGYDKLYLPRGFVTANGLEIGCKEIVLKNEAGRSWSLVLKHYKPHGLTYLERGWISFCQVNGIKLGDSFMFKLVGTKEKPVLSLCPAESKTPLEFPQDVMSLSSNHSSGGDGSSEEESNSQECVEIAERKNWSSSSSQKQFVRLTLTPYAFRCYKLILPLRFTRVNGINKPGKITLLGQDGVKLVVDLLQDKRNKRMRLGPGWRDFCIAHGVKIRESFVLELIWEEEANPVLKFCTKVKSV